MQEPEEDPKRIFHKKEHREKKNIVKNLNDEKFMEIYKSSKSISEMTRKVGLKSTASIKKRLQQSINDEEFKKFVRRNVSSFKDISVEKLRQIVSESSTWSDIYTKLGYARGSGTLARNFKPYLDANEIDYSHLPSGREWQRTPEGKNHIRKCNTKNQTYSNEEMFQNGTKHNNSTLKMRILRDNLKEYKCSICDIGPEWQGKPMTLILDHINGIRNDNRLENLRFHCANCGIQLDTHGSKNKAYLTEEDIKRREERREAMKKHCIDCQTEICRSALRCATCSSYSTRKVKEIPSLEKLKEDIILLGMKGTGEKYGVSDNAVKKWFRKKGEEPPKIQEISKLRKERGIKMPRVSESDIKN